tara:strand:- start:21 stop:944 length:924 start_codon:yes stop_codon:yes gene_type:complete
MALPTNVGSTFTGKAAGFYISAALKQANSLDFITSMENVKYKQVIQRMEGSGIADATCDFTAAGTLALTEAVITPKSLQINMDICSENLLSSWESLQMKAGAGSPPPVSFDDYVISHMGGLISQGVETSIWGGNDATAGEFTGFVTGGAVGRLVQAGNTVVDVANVGGAATAYSATNIIENLQNAAAAISSAVYMKEDLYIYMSPKTWRLYISAVSALTSFPFANMNDDYTKVFEGLKLAVCNGMLDDQLVCAEKSNLYYGTDLLSDTTRIDLLDMRPLNGSQNLRLVARFTGGTQVGIGADVVLVS